MTTAVETVTIGNELGLHARPAAQLVNIANSFKSSLKLDTCKRMFTLKIFGFYRYNKRTVCIFSRTVTVAHAVNRKSALF